MRPVTPFIEWDGRTDPRAIESVLADLPGKGPVAALLAWLATESKPNAPRADSISSQATHEIGWLGTESIPVIVLRLTRDRGERDKARQVNEKTSAKKIPDYYVRSIFLTTGGYAGDMTPSDTTNRTAGQPWAAP